MTVLKSPGTRPVRVFAGRSGGTTCEHSQELTPAPGIKSDWCIYGIRAVYGFLALLEPRQSWWALWLRFLPGTVSSVPSPTGEVVMSEAREVYARLSTGTFEF